MLDLLKRTPQRGSPIISRISQASREVSTSYRDVDGEPEEEPEFALLASKPKEGFQKIYTLSTHDKCDSRDVLLNKTMFPAHIIQEGTLMQMATLQSYPAHEHHLDSPKADLSSPYLFYVKFANSQVLSKQPNLQVSFPQQIASALHLARSTPVMLSTVFELAWRASHVELVFRDQYLARADMWRLINDQLAGHCVYRGQNLEFIGTIKATIKTIFIGGRKVNSGIFHASTKPIFRSESARYVLFIQMSKEMWDFEAGGTGEIMFDKVLNGFLPELFKRWHQMQVRHLVSVVLFTRMEYDDRAPLQSRQAFGDHHHNEELKNAGSRDYYRVVVSDMASGESVSILDRLKKEFQVFLRDTSTRKPAKGDYAPIGSGLSAASAVLPDRIIAGQPCAAARGNILEAINLASSQFSSDYIDRDLVRTGVSIVIISPGTGIFEVDYNLLVATTDNLTDNGVGIDLVCLSKMPLHSVPLFKYRQPRVQRSTTGKPQDLGADNTPIRSFSNTMSYESPSASSLLSNRSPGQGNSGTPRPKYAVPHWVDVSFWTNASDELSILQHTRALMKANRNSFESPKHKPFKPRVRMYELQMMGVMENGISDISIPTMPYSIRSAMTSGHKYGASQSPRLIGSFKEDSQAGSMSSRDGAFGLQALKLSTSPLSLSGDYPNENQASLRGMDEYDDRLFRHPAIVKARLRYRRSPADKTFQLHKQSTLSRTPMAMRTMKMRNDGSSENISLLTTSSSYESYPITISGNRKSLLKPKLTSRKISIGPRGLSVGAPKVAAAIADTNPVSRNVSGGQWQRQPAAWPADILQDPLDPVTAFEQASRQTAMDRARILVESSQEESHSSDDSGPEASMPIPIRKTAAIQIMKENREKRARKADHPQPHDRVAALKDMREQEGLELSDINAQMYGPDLPTLSPSTSMAPWLTVLNPCNPSKKLMASSSRLGRWHHVFPRPLKTSQVKWKSLCSPATVPLTTDDFPSADQFVEEYRETSYLVTLPEEMDLTDRHRSLVNELLAFRLARGFQIVIGDGIADAIADPSMRSLDVFNDMILAQPGSSIFLSRGNMVHHLTRVATDRIEIKIHLRHTTAKVNSETEDTQVFYTPRIRSMLAVEYEPQEILIAPQRGYFDWHMIDSFITGHERFEATQYIEILRPWRARFVLIPVDAPDTSRRRNKSNEDTEEEIRLEGIQKLTQIWQRSSYMGSEHRRFASPSMSYEDENPPEVKYYTKDPSAVVAEEVENAAVGDAISAPIHLPLEADLYQRSTLDLKSLASKIQSEKGVLLVDRRWHWKLHHDCFVGSELTTWLLKNFRDVTNRQEAVDVGNVLMRDGLFKHVERRHEFRDGHYFYRMGDDYRVSRSESRSLFGWSKAPVSITPMKGLPTPEPPIITHPQTSSDAESIPGSDAPKPPQRDKRPTVALGKSLVYNLDDRHKRSYREELVNLHYDRLHNPDNCFHIRLEWMNTTPKLIQDAIVKWARLVEPHGLCLVEVPIGEACSITSMHPFRAPYLIRLVEAPPAKQPMSYIETKGCIQQAKPAEKNYYQKALLRRFNFVLDFEAVSDFPAEVDVTYSWGKPDYRYPQYIHRSGLLLAQVTDEGHFLLLANRLYNNRSLSARIRTSDNQGDGNFDHKPMLHRSSPLRSTDGLTQPASPRSSPFSSSPVRAALDVPNASPSMSRSPLSNTTFSQKMPQERHHSTSSFVDPEKFTRDFEDFCHNTQALESFYAEELSKAPSPSPSTPVTFAIRTPSKGRNPPLKENTIPDLTLPDSLTDQGAC
ncbi:MAG: hypothetical protein Q9217_003719 [Psora testacea]